MTRKYDYTMNQEVEGYLNEEDSKSDSTWTTKDGRTLKIKDLTDSHLMNIIRMIERQYARTIGTYLIEPGPQGDMAQDAFDREFDQLEEEGPEGFNPKYEFLVEEADKRKIDSFDKREFRLLSLDIAVLKIATRK